MRQERGGERKNYAGRGDVYGENEARRNEGAYSAPKSRDKVKILHNDEKNEAA